MSDHGNVRRLRRWSWLLLVLLSVFLHLWGLGGRSYHHDESIHAKLSYDLATRGVYRYDPTYHGPLLYYLTAATVLVHDSDFTARLPIALAGIGMLWVAWRLRAVLGERAAWWSGLLFTISPLFLFYGRFLRMDVLEVVTASGALLAWAEVLRAERARQVSARRRQIAWVSLGAWTALAFATKENAYVTAALVGAAAGAMAAYRGLTETVPQALGWLRRSLPGVIISLSVFVLVAVPLYTVAFSHPEDWMFPVRAISYWWGQHNVERVGGPWWFHLPRLLQYEFLVLGAALAWLGRRLLRLRPVEQFLGIAGVGSIVMYCYLGEKVPWLGVHQVWPFVPLAGAQLARTMGERGRWWSRALAVSGLGATVLVSLVANFSLHEITPRQRRVESLHFVQTCPELQQVVADGLEYGAEGGLVAAVSGEAAWPLTWYWRDLPVFWAKPGNGSRPPLVVCDPEDESEVFEVLGPEYARERIPLRAWWLMYQWPSPAVGILEWLRGGEDRGSVFDVRGAAVARYFLTRIPWGVVGSTDVIVFRRRDGSAPSTRLAPVPEAVQQELGFTSARVVGEGWLAEPRGIDLVGQRLVAADVALSRIARVDHEGSVRAVELGGLLQPEAVAWRGDRALVVADTWNHRVVVAELGEDGLTELPAPEGGWYGPRAVAVGPGGQIAVADTGHKQVVLYDGDLALAGVLQAEAAGGLDEPGGVAWVDADSLLVCDTGNRRVLVLGVGGEVEQEVAIPRAWADYYSRPQATVLGARQWLVSDTPGSALWLVRDGVPVRLGLEVSGLAPTGLAWDAASGTLAVADLRSGVWLFEREGEGRDDDQ